MKVHIEHIGLWVRDIDAVAAFYANYLGARIGERYQNPRKGFESRFLAFDSGARLEIMTRTDVTARSDAELLGLAHVAIAVGDDSAVDELAARFRADGVPIDSGPRRTGDGYYECVARDPEGNRVEIAADNGA
jgi:lactoylglutathione lyase